MRVAVLLSISLVLGACSSTPVSQEEMSRRVYRHHVAQACIQQGMTAYPAEMAIYAKQLGREIFYGGVSREAVSAEHARANQQHPVGTIPRSTCRTIEAEALAYAQEQQAAQREKEAQLAQPKSVYCQHYGHASYCW